MRLNNKYSVNVNGAAITTVAIARVLQVHFMYGDSVPGGRLSSNQASRLELSLRVGCYHLHRKADTHLPSHEGWKAESTYARQ